MLKESNNTGFTLVEMVISLTIVALVLAIIFSMLKLGYSSTEKGEKVITENQRERISHTTISRQISSYYPYMIKQGNDNVPFFMGDDDEIFFATAYSVSFGADAGIMFAAYKIKGDDEEDYSIGVKEVLITGEDIFEAYSEGDELMIKEILSRSAKSEVELLKRHGSLKFRFFNRHDDGWKESWDYRAEKRAPSAVGLFSGDEPQMVLPVFAGVITSGSM